MPRSKKLPYLPWFFNDWESDPGIRGLDYWDRGVWISILGLMHYSQDRGKLLIEGRPMDDETMARILRLSLNDSDGVRGLKTTLSNISILGVSSRCEKTGALMNRRMVRDEKLRKIFKESGKKGGNPAIRKPLQTNDNRDTLNPTLNPPVNQTYGNGNGDGIGNKKKEGSAGRKKKAAKSTPYSELFGRFWKEYPRGEDKSGAYSSWTAILSTSDFDEPELLSRIEHALLWQKQSDQWTKERGHFIPMPTTYLNNHRWEDKPIIIPKKSRIATAEDAENYDPHATD